MCVGVLLDCVRLVGRFRLTAQQGDGVTGKMEVQPPPLTNQQITKHSKYGPLVGSSRKRRDGFAISSTPTETRFRSPPDTPRTRWSPVWGFGFGFGFGSFMFYCELLVMNGRINDDDDESVCMIVLDPWTL